MSALLSTRDLTLRVAGRTLLEGLDLDIQAGECWAVLGPNGTGKTTLLHTLAGLREPQAGSVSWQGRPLTGIPRRELARHLGLLLQDDHDPFPANVLETVLTGRHPHLGRWGWEGPSDLALARQALHAVDLAELEDRPLVTLSGGERRRLAIATLFTQDPRLALLDEPTNHLDLHHQVGLLQQLHDTFTADGRALLLVLHDINLALRCCDHLLLLHGDGRWESGRAAELASAERLSVLYGQPLRAIDGDGRRYFTPA
jgi:iron complex transport system ATP-binding protein